MSNARQFGKFTLLRRIATGGMAEIFLARQSGPAGFEKLVVIKRILDHLTSDNDFVQMFLDEARIAARLNHPNIVQIYDLGVHDNSYFIAMEYLTGESLSAVVKQCSRQGQFVPLGFAARATAWVCEGLYYAHNLTDIDGTPLRIIHRDVSPQNVIVTYDGAVKLVDFGIAKAAVKQLETRAGMLKGKYSYMSPEQCRGKPLDQRSDIFSLGIVLWEMLTGQRLFKYPNIIQIMEAITEGAVRPPSDLRPEISKALDEITLKALSKKVENRYGSCREMQADLEHFLREDGGSVGSIELSGFIRSLFASRIAELKKVMEDIRAEDLRERAAHGGGGDNGTPVAAPRAAAPPAPPPPHFTPVPAALPPLRPGGTPPGSASHDTPPPAAARAPDPPAPPKTPEDPYRTLIVDFDEFPHMRPGAGPLGPRLGTAATGPPLASPARAAAAAPSPAPPPLQPAAASTADMSAPVMTPLSAPHSRPGAPPLPSLYQPSGVAEVPEDDIDTAKPGTRVPLLATSPRAGKAPAAPPPRPAPRPVGPPPPPLGPAPAAAPPTAPDTTGTGAAPAPRTSWVGMLVTGLFVVLCVGVLIAAILHVRGAPEERPRLPSASAQPVPVPALEEGMD